MEEEIIKKIQILDLTRKVKGFKYIIGILVFVTLIINIITISIAISAINAHTTEASKINYKAIVRMLK
jgi:hypothetical protein